MRKLLILVFTPMLALAVFLLGSPAAHAFGSEVLGCAFDSAAWTANSCAGGGDSSVHNTVHFSAHNLSGTYTKAWTVTNMNGFALSNCSSPVAADCISGGCTSTSTTCDLIVRTSATHDKPFTASLRLTQAGQTRTITAVAVVNREVSGCTDC